MTWRLGSLALPLMFLGACSSDDGESEDTSTPDDTGASDAGSTASTDAADMSDLSDVGDGYAVGVDVRDFTPTSDWIETGEIYMGAYGLGGSRPAATSIHDEVYTRSMVIRSGTSGVALVILDLPGASNRILNAMVDGAAERTGLPREAIYIGNTHSHSAPDLQGLWGGVPDPYKQYLIDVTIESIAAAFEGAAPATLKVSKTTGPNRNRREWDHTDDEMTVLDAIGQDGARIGTLVNFAAHPVILGAGNLEMSRDFPGYVVDFMEAQLDAPVLYFNGVVGDCSPAGGESQPDCVGVQCQHQRAESYGNMVADVALAAMGDQTDVTPEIHFDLRPWFQEVTNAGFVAMYNIGLLDYDVIQDGNNLGIDTQGAYFRLGAEVQGIAWPGEALTRTGLDLKGELAAPFKLWLGLTTDSLGYFILPDEWNSGRNGNYEESVSMGETAAATALDNLRAAVADDASF